MNYFADCKTMAEGKKLYRELLKKNHPDAGGSEEVCKAIVLEFEKFLEWVMMNAFTDAGDKKTKDYNVYAFADILKAIKDFNMRIEIIGFWIYCFEGSYGYKETLKEKGFWFSKSKKAWIYNGSSKKTYGYGYSLDRVKSMHGSEVFREREEDFLTIPA